MNAEGKLADLSTMLKEHSAALDRHAAAMQALPGQIADQVHTAQIALALGLLLGFLIGLLLRRGGNQ